jgi:hypothetical protein
VKGEITPAIVRVPSKRMFHFQCHFHSGYSTIGDSRNSCMSTARYQDSLMHCKKTRFVLKITFFRFYPEDEGSRFHRKIDSFLTRLHVTTSQTTVIFTLTLSGLNFFTALYINPVRTSQETHYVSATKPNRLMLFGETDAVYCENHTEHTDTLCGQTVEFVPHRKHITSPLQSPTG